MRDVLRDSTADDILPRNSVVTPSAFRPNRWFAKLLK
jgi:hypothetical protein